MTRQTDWYHENKDRARENTKKWREQNKDKVSEQNRRYREAFKKKHGMSPSQYYAKKRREKNDT